MGDAAEKLERLAGLLAELAPPPVPVPEWMPLRAEAKRRALSTSTLRAWCLRHSVEIREESHRDAWVRPAAIDEPVFA